MTAHIEQLESRRLLSAISADAADLVNQRVSLNQETFYIFKDLDSPYNHGLPSEFPQAYVDKVTNTTGVHDAGGPTGLSTDPNTLDRQRGTVFAATFDPLVGTEFAGVSFREPVNGKGYNLTGATRVLLDVSSPTGITVTFGVDQGEAHNSLPIVIPPSNTFSTIEIPFSSLNLTSSDLIDVNILFSIGTSATFYPGGASSIQRTILVDNIRMDPVPFMQQSALG
ncbi:MAG: hypothetical protein KDA84_25170, partial [Planctomycetaceae bacterium]|nr:hypothetical protein [Planctomycetaceae bacterium]